MYVIRKSVTKKARATQVFRVEQKVNLIELLDTATTTDINENNHSNVQLCYKPTRVSSFYHVG